MPAISASRNLKIKQLSNIADIYEIYKEIGGQSRPLFRILELAYRAGARYCLIWNDRNNGEWEAEHSELYSRIYPRIPKYVIRIDFFSRNPFEGEAKYFGYASLRPGPIRTVVESLLTPPQTQKNHYLICGGKYDTKYPDQNGNLVSAVIENACPFVQQDGVIGICAHASIRMLSMALSCTSKKCKSMTVTDIRQRVTAMPLLEGSHFPSTGLVSFEIVNAIEGMGATAVLYLFERGRERSRGLPIERVVYPYVESGIPVIVGIETENSGHAVVVVGHTFDQDSWWQQAEYGYFPSFAGGITWIPSYIWTPEFIVQDDNFGPYMSCPRTLLGMTTNHVIVPTPNDCPVLLPGYAPEILVVGYLSSRNVASYFILSSKTRKPWKDIFPNVFRTENVVLRPLLVKKEQFINHIKSVSLSSETIKLYEDLKLPQWVWIVEISLPGLYSRGEKIGEVVLNPTYPIQHIKRGGLEPLLAMRLFDVITIGNTFTKRYITHDKEPVSVYTRTAF